MIKSLYHPVHIRDRSFVFLLDLDEVDALKNTCVLSSDNFAIEGPEPDLRKLRGTDFAEVTGKGYALYNGLTQDDVDPVFLINDIKGRWFLRTTKGGGYKQITEPEWINEHDGVRIYPFRFKR